MTLASQPRIGRAYAGVLMYIPAILGAILVSALPFSNKVGLLFSYWISSEPSCNASRVPTSDNHPSVFAISPFTIFLGWVASITAGHTKRELIFSLTSNRSLIDCLQVSPQMPSYYVLMRSEMPSASLCGSRSTSHSTVHPAVPSTELMMLQEPCPVGCYHCHQFCFRSHPHNTALSVLA